VVSKPVAAAAKEEPVVSDAKTSPKKTKSTTFTTSSKPRRAPEPILPRETRSKSHHVEEPKPTVATEKAKAGPTKKREVKAASKKAANEEKKPVVARSVTPVKRS
jgi:hypothetical protein